MLRRAFSRFPAPPGLAVSCLCAGLCAVSQAFAVAPPRPTLQVELQGGALKLGLEGTPGRAYRIEEAVSLAESETPGAWTMTMTLNLADTPRVTWVDLGAAAAGSAHRFFRAREWDAAASGAAPDFRLLDHAGRSRSLSYNSDANAVILVFTTAVCGPNATEIAILKTLQARHGAAGLRIWVLRSEADVERGALAREADDFGPGILVLHDSARAVAAAYDVRETPEVVCVDPAAGQIFYRGRIGVPGRSGAEATGASYLAQALAAFLDGRPITITATRPEGCPLGLPPADTLSYAHDIAPILVRSCVSCHSSGNIAPWTMTDFESVAQRSPTLLREVLEGSMPPWHADPTHGEFANDSSLTGDDKLRLVQWLRRGAPRGDGADPLPGAQPPPAPDWPLGTPDRILRIRSQTLPATGDIDYVYEVMRSPFASSVWLRAAHVRPTNARVVHHALVFSGTDAEILALLGGLGGYTAGYVPGQDQATFPENTGKLLKAGDYIIFQMHYTSTGQPETDRTELGLYLAPTPPAQQLRTVAASTTSIFIPPGAPEAEHQAEMILPTDALVFELSPHMHFRGARFRFEAISPEGEREVLLSVPDYRFDWQRMYRLATPKRLRAGTRILCTGAFDNSDRNAHNPDPTATVGFGLQTWEEMFIGYINYVDATRAQ
jgi:hypothetical protein